MNIDYSSDRETFSRLIRGRGIAAIFPLDIGRLFYDRIQDAAPGESFVLHQRAVFEMQHVAAAIFLDRRQCHHDQLYSSGAFDVKHEKRLARPADAFQQDRHTEQSPGES